MGNDLNSKMSYFHIGEQSFVHNQNDYTQFCVKIILVTELYV